MNATVIKSAWHGLSAAVMQNAPAIAAGLAIAAGAVALYKAAKQGSVAKEELERAKQAKRDEELAKLRKAIEELEDQASPMKEKLEGEIEKVQNSEPKLERKETTAILARAMWKPAIWGFTAAICVIASVVFAQKQIKAATALAAAASTMMSDRIAAEGVVLGDKKAREISENLHTTRAATQLQKYTNGQMQVVQTGLGEDLFIETTYTGLAFYSNVPEVRSAVERCNRRLRDGERLSVNDYLDEITAGKAPLPTHYNHSGFMYEPEMPQLSDELTIELYGVRDLITLPNGLTKSAIAIALENTPHDVFSECY